MFPRVPASPSRAAHRALVVGAGFVLAATIVALLAPNRRQTEAVVEEEPALDLAA